METKQLIKQYKSNDKEMTSLEKEKDNSIEVLDKGARKIENDCYDKVEILEKAKREKIIVIRDKQKNVRIVYDDRCEELCKIKEKIKRIVAFLEIEDEGIGVKDNKITNYRDRKIEPLGYIFDEEFYKIKAFIVENDKPKNKYSLEIYGKNLFRKELIEIPYGYGLNSSSNYEGYNLQISLKDAPTIEELKIYLDKDKDKILEKCKISEVEETYREYLGVLQNYNIEEFKCFEVYKSFRSLYGEREEKIRKDFDTFMKSNPHKQGTYGNYEVEEFYEDNKKDYNFKEIEIN